MGCRHQIPPLRPHGTLPKRMGSVSHRRWRTLRKQGLLNQHEQISYEFRVISSVHRACTGLLWLALMTSTSINLQRGKEALNEEDKWIFHQQERQSIAAYVCISHAEHRAHKNRMSQKIASNFNWIYRKQLSH